MRIVDTEQLRQALLNEIYAGAFTGMPAMLALEDEIRTAELVKLIEIADHLGMGGD